MNFASPSPGRSARWSTRPRLRDEPRPTGGDITGVFPLQLDLSLTRVAQRGETGDECKGVVFSFWASSTAQAHSVSSFIIPAPVGHSRSDLHAANPAARWCQRHEIRIAFQDRTPEIGDAQHIRPGRPRVTVGSDAGAALENASTRAFHVEHAISHMTVALPGKRIDVPVHR